MSDSGRHGAMFRILAMLPEASRARMARMYCESLQQLLPELGDAVEGAREEETRALAHKVAGAAAMLQDERLAALARRIEELILAAQAADAYALWPAAQAAAGESLAALAAVYPPLQ